MRVARVSSLRRAAAPHGRAPVTVASARRAISYVAPQK